MSNIKRTRDSPDRNPRPNQILRTDLPPGIDVAAALPESLINILGQYLSPTVFRGWRNGVYHGHIDDLCRPHGHGSYTVYPNNCRYTGRFERGEFVSGKQYLQNKLQYSGAFLDGKRHGRGSLYHPDTAHRAIKYKGSFLDGKFHGNGTMFYRTGGIEFRGSFEKGKKHGEGIEYNVGGSMVFVGTFKQGLPHGNGHEYYVNSSQIKFEGVFERGFPKSGVLFNTDGKKIYKGGFESGWRTGRGTAFFYDEKGQPDGRYEGHWYMNQRKGKGKEFDSNNKLMYSGSWKNDLRHGKGLQKTTNGHYVGSFEKNKRHGLGTEYENSVMVYQGNWKYGQRNGYGTHIRGIKIIYRGMWLNNKYHGKGVFYFKDGSSFSGNFVEGKQHGRGTMSIKGEEFNCSWTRGRPPPRLHMWWNAL